MPQTAIRGDFLRRHTFTILAQNSYIKGAFVGEITYSAQNTYIKGTYLQKRAWSDLNQPHQIRFGGVFVPGACG